MRSFDIVVGRLAAFKEQFKKLTEDLAVSGWPGAMLVQALPGGLSLALLVYLLMNARRGLETSDESYYVKFALAPLNVEMNPNLFGFALHPFFALTGFDIGLFRSGGMLALFAIGGALTWSAVRLVRPQSRTTMILHAVIGGACLLSFYAFWLPTPGYNWLAIAASALAGVGACLGVTALSAPMPPVLGVIAVGLIGWAGFLMAMARPVTALVVGAGILLGVWQLRRSAIAVISIAAICATAAMGITLVWLLAFAGPQHYVAVVRDGLEFFTFDQGLHRIPKQLRALPGELPALSRWIVAIAALVFLAIPGIMRNPNARARIRSLKIARAVGFLVLAMMLMVWPRSGGLTHVAIVAMLMGLSSACIGLSQLAIEGGDQAGLAALWMLSLLLLLAPLTLALGGNNPVLSLAPLASGQFLLAGFIPIAACLPKQRWIYAGVCLGSLAIVAQTVAIGSTTPYRLAAPIARQSIPISLPVGGKLQVDAATATWIGELQSAARRHGIGPATDLLDLTGRTPGLALIIGARSPVHPWVPSGYAASQLAIDETFRRIPLARLHDSWLAVAIEPRFDEAVLRQLLPGARYTLVGEFVHPVHQLRFVLLRPDPNGEPR